MVTIQANNFDVGDGTFVRDSQADALRGRQAARRGRKRKAEAVNGCHEHPVERLLKLPRMAELRHRVLAKAIARASAQPGAVL